MHIKIIMQKTTAVFSCSFFNHSIAMQNTVCYTDYALQYKL